MSDPAYALTGLDRVFHEPGRLGICSALIANAGGLSFTQLQDACGLTDGNLNRHLHALAELGVVESERITGKGRPQTIVRMSTAGRARFLAYIDELESLVRDVQRSRSRKTVQRTIPTG